MSEHDNPVADPVAMTPEQRKCDDEVGHNWRHVAYEPDVNYGGFKECELCGWTEADDEDYGSDFDDNYM